MRVLILALLLVIPSLAQTFGGHCEGANPTNGGDTSHSTSTCTSVPANAFFMCFIRQDTDTTAPSSVTDGNGAAMTHVTQADSSMDAGDLATIWWIKTTGFTGTATVNWASAHNFDSIACRWYTGQDLSSPIDVNNITTTTASTVTTLVSNSFTTANANETIVICTSPAATNETFSVGLIAGTNGGNLFADNIAGSQMSACEDRTVSSTQTSVTGQLNWDMGASAELSGITIKLAPPSITGTTVVGPTTILSPVTIR